MIKRVLYTFVYAMLFVSCANSGNLPRKIDEFVADTEASAEYMTAEDWELSSAQYEAMLEEFVENYDLYTPEERQEVYEAVGRYNGLLVKQGLTELQIQTSEFMKNLNKALEELPNALNGWLEGFKNGLE